MEVLICQRTIRAISRAKILSLMVVNHQEVVGNHTGSKPEAHWSIQPVTQLLTTMWITAPELELLTTHPHSPLCKTNAKSLHGITHSIHPTSRGLKTLRRFSQNSLKEKDLLLVMLRDFSRKKFRFPKKNFSFTEYSCALQKDILVHGRLYVSKNYLCFYSNIFRWETCVSPFFFWVATVFFSVLETVLQVRLRWKDVKNIVKEKTALVIPNAIEITTSDERYFFTSFLARDRAFMMLFKLWQNALLDQVRKIGQKKTLFSLFIFSQNIRRIIKHKQHSFYINIWEQHKYRALP